MPPLHVTYSCLLFINSYASFFYGFSSRKFKLLKVWDESSFSYFNQNHKLKPKQLTWNKSALIKEKILFYIKELFPHIGCPIRDIFRVPFSTSMEQKTICLAGSVSASVPRGPAQISENHEWRLDLHWQ